MYYVLPLFAVGKLCFVMAFCVGLHELGHYFAALSCGITPVSFSIGVGPEVWSGTDRRGTVWRIGALPLGGYVEMPTARVRRLAQIWVFLAGPLANFVTGLVLLTGVVLYDGCTVVVKDEQLYVRVADVMEVECPRALVEERPLFGATSQVPGCTLVQAVAVACAVLYQAAERSAKGFARACKAPTSVIEGFKGPLGIGRMVLSVGSVLGLLCLVAQLAFSLGLFNLLPLLPLDGGMVLCACLGIDLEKDGWVLNLLTWLALIPLVFVVVVCGADLWRLCRDFCPVW